MFDNLSLIVVNRKKTNEDDYEYAMEKVYKEIQVKN